MHVHFNFFQINIGFDIFENEPSKVWYNGIFRFLTLTGLLNLSPDGEKRKNEAELAELREKPKRFAVRPSPSYMLA